MLYCSRTGRVAMASPGDEDTWRSAPSLQVSFMFYSCYFVTVKSLRARAAIWDRADSG